MSRHHRARAGFTMLEMLISLSVLTIVVTAGLSFYRTQSMSFARGAMEAYLTQTLVYTASTLGQYLRTAGTNLVPGQPFLVYADADVVAFHADYVTNIANDPFAVHHDPHAPAGSVAAPTSRSRFTLPGSTFSYPDTTYRGGGGANSGAELIIFYIEPDTGTVRSDDYMLVRKINDGPPELIARDLLRDGSAAFFEYHRLVGSEATGRLAPVSRQSLPLRHSAPWHLSAADTGRAAVIDSVRAVRLRVRATNGLSGAEQRTQLLWKMIHLPNAGLQTEQSCGSRPMFGGGVTATGRLVSGAPEVELTWGQAIDEAGGERDVVRYVVWRSPAGGPVAAEPLLSVAAGESSYRYVDRGVTAGASYVYAVAAQDCTPSLSEQGMATAAVPVP